nr:MAG TPA: hypothetical protein [Caudoviricetes sp.]
MIFFRKKSIKSRSFYRMVNGRKRGYYVSRR